MYDNIGNSGKGNYVCVFLGNLFYDDNWERFLELNFCKNYGVESGIIEVLMKCCGFVILSLGYELREGLLVFIE